MELLTASAQETQDFGKKIAASLTPSEDAKTISLTGGLGSGKTTFTQGFALGLGILDRIVSPTFILMRTYTLPPGQSFRKLYHLDLYRLDGNIEQQMKDLGILEVWDDSQNIVLIEWAEKAGNFLPKDTINIAFETVNDTVRKITLTDK